MIKTSYLRSSATFTLLLACLITFASGAPVILEFMASNNKALYDEDGESSDWIEIYNPDAIAVNLDGYFISNDPGNLAMWRLPNLSLPAGGYLIVFASNKDRDVGELHTNFRLSKDAGEYLALVDPDGQSIISEFANYPVQFDDFSYGSALNSGTVGTVLVREGDACKVLVPTGDIGTTWYTDPNFDDSAWLDATTGIGFERDEGYENLIGAGGDVETLAYDINATAYIRIPFTVDSPASAVSLTFRMKYDDGFVAYLNGTQIASGNAPASPVWDSQSTFSHSDSLAVNFENTNLSAQAGTLLQSGENWLTIHALNLIKLSADFLALPRLEAEFTSTGGAGEKGYFQSSSPGLPNGSDQGLPAGDVTMSVPGRGFTGLLSVSLSTASPTAQIRYTTDGNVPNETSSFFSGSPITISSSTLLRARAFETELTPGAVAEEGYIRLSSNADTFSSDIPVIIMERFSGGPSAANGKTFTFFAFFEPDPGTGRTTLNRPYTLGTRGGWKVRGSSSAGFAKKAFSIEAWNELNRNKDIEPLGLPAESDWILNARSQFDRSLMRNTFIYELSNQVGRYATRTKFVELFKDDNGGDLNYSSDYAGVYTFMEKITRDKDRVDVERLPDSVTEEPAISGGYIMKIDRLDPGDSGLSAGGRSLGWVYPKEEDVTSAQSSWLRDYLNAMNTSLSGSSYADYIDVDQWIDHHWMNVLTLNADALRLSTYFHKKRNERMAFGPIWDFDRSMDSTDGRDDNPSTWQGGTNYFTYPWWSTLFEDENFWQQYIDRYFELRNSEFATTNIHSIIDGMAAELNEAQVRNFQKWSSQLPRFGGYQGEVDHLKTWLATRLTWIDGQFAPLPDTNRADGIYPAGTTFSLSAPLGATQKIYYTLDGTDPRPPTNRGDLVGNTLYDETQPVRAFVPTSDIGTDWRSNLNFNDASWLSGTNGVGYERSSGYQNYINIDVNTSLGSAGSCYIRIKFDVDANAAELATWNFMSLDVRYDDGFVAYLNGTQITTANAPGGLNWASYASQTHGDGEAVVFQIFDVSQFVNLLQPGENLLAVHGLNGPNASSDFLNQSRLIAGVDENSTGGTITATEYTGPVTLSETARLFARVFDSTGGHSTSSNLTPVGTGWSAPLRAEYLINEVPADATNFAISEIMANPYDLGNALTADSEFDFIELQNTSNGRISLTGVQFVDGITFHFSTGSVPSLAPGERVIVVKNLNAFRQVYGTGRNAQIAGTYTGSLSGSGETLEIRAANGTVIQNITYPDSGAKGRSLLADGASWITSRSLLGSPGTAEPTTTEIPDIVINEVLSNSVTPNLDAVEILNTGPAAFDIGGWFLTDDLSEPEKFRISDNTILGAGQFLTFTESDFNPTPGTGGSFALSSFGEEIFLISALPDGTRTDYVAGFDFGDASAGVPFGRHILSTGEIDYPPLITATFDSTNAAPLAGPLVITELMYHPLDGASEYVEILNNSSSSVPLAGVEISGTGFVFNAGAPGLAPGEYVLITDIDPANFRLERNPPASVGVYGPYPGKLDNGGEKLRIRIPESTGIPAEPNLMVSIDIANFSDSAPWPAEADGQGYALQRIMPPAYGSDPVNWGLSKNGGSPGREDWRAQFFNGAELSDLSISGILADADHDGMNNLLEYLLGSELKDSSSANLPEISLFENGGEMFGRFVYKIRNGVDEYSLTSEMSSDLDGWNPANLQIINTVDNGDGTSTVTAETTDPIDEETYFRLRVLED